jgi:hypothetical protein
VCDDMMMQGVAKRSAVCEDVGAARSMRREHVCGYRTEYSWKYEEFLGF